METTCIQCNKPLEYRQVGRPPKRCPTCRALHRREDAKKRVAKYRLAHPDRIKASNDKHNAKNRVDPAFLQRKRDNDLRRSYGLTRYDLDAMLEAQNHLCAICAQAHVGPGTRLHVDHCHTTNKVRGLLCGRCNTMLGLVGDDIARLEAAIAYLRLHGVI